MLKYLLVLSLFAVGCGKYIEVEPLVMESDEIVYTQPASPDIDINIVVEGDTTTVEQTVTGTTAAPSETTVRPPTKSCSVCAVKSMFKCTVHDFNGRSSLLADLYSSPIIGSFTMDQFDVTPRDWNSGFPKLPSSLSHLRENYAIRCMGKLYVATTGMHGFSMTSDDGMRLLLNGIPAIQDDGLHAPRTTNSNVYLSKGFYKMEVQWFQGPRTQIAAELKMSTPADATLSYVYSSTKKKACK